MISTRSFFWHIVISIILLITQINAYTIHQNCYDQRKDHLVEEAVDEALNLAEYAKFRVERNSPRWNEDVFTALMPSKPEFTSAMSKVSGAVGTFKGKFDRTNIGKDPSVVVACGDNYLESVEVRGRRYFLDRDLRTLIDMTPSGRRICEDGVNEDDVTRAYQYNITPRGRQAPHSVIVLCRIGAKTEEGWQKELTYNERWNTLDWEDVSFDAAVEWTSAHILHEVMHTPPIGMPGQDGVYTYYEMGRLSPDRKVRNAENHAMLAVALYMAEDSWVLELDEEDQPGLTPRAGFGPVLNHDNRPNESQLGPHDYP